MTDLYRPRRLLVYVLASDNGLAPNITGGVLTLSVCKPVVRRTARVGLDWLVGMSTNRHGKTRLVYASTVARKIPFGDYWADPTFAMKKPTPQATHGDNFFAPGPDGTLAVAVPECAHANSPGRIQRDLNAPVSVVGGPFWYFGANAPHLPDGLHNTRLVQGNRRGHRVVEGDAVERFYTWLMAYAAPGIHGAPRDGWRA